jgi:hypothetical protein
LRYHPLLKIDPGRCPESDITLARHKNRWGKSGLYAVKTVILGPEDAAEQDVLRSELWTTLFRGGYMIGKLQHSLSGKFVRI